MIQLSKTSEVEMFTFDNAKLKEIMIAKGWTVEQLAQLAGTSRQSIHNTMSGRNSPSVKSLLAICNASGTQPGYFFTQTVEKPNNE